MKANGRQVFALLLAAAVVAGPARSLAGQEVDARTVQAVHLLQRATYGPRAGDIERVLEMGVEGWLDWQMMPEAIDDSALEERLVAFEAAAMSPAELLTAYPPPGFLRRQMGEGDSLTPERRREIMREMGVRPPGRIVVDLAGARLQRAVYSERQLEQVLTDFWFNHFNVFWGKGPAKWVVGDFEAEAIRPHVFGTFEEMLVAVASHPAMLVYLDNWRSAAPDSRAARAAERSGRPNLPTGINENYARELLELHTLGVDGGYTQPDVVAVARAFTGWTLDGGRGVRGRQPSGGGPRAAGFRFHSEMHDTGQKTVLGHSLPAGRGMEDGMDVLHILATDPSTARHVATRLVTAFVTDSAPAALVDELARVFLETGGDLAAVTRALFSAPTFYAASNVGAKVRSPFELVASALRMTGAEAGPSRGLLGALRSLDHLPYLESAPTGYPDSDAPWVSSGAMLQRMNLALALASGSVDGVRIDHGRTAMNGQDPLDAMLAALLPGADTGRLEAAVRRDLAQASPGDRDGAERALGLILGSPEFQHQ